MRKKFSSLPHRIVTLQHGDDSTGETLEFRVEALPAGYDTFIRQVFPRPERTMNGAKPIPLSPKESALYNNRFGYIMLERGLRSDGCIETEPPGKSAGSAEWAQFADNVEREFVVAGFSEGDAKQLLEAVGDLSQGVVVQRGN